ncbi:carboxypeptidase-like regulatory domain-containing protein [Lutibacter holmesii]|uniref:Carboxypeptidase-like regulatory domain-containing protein n=1 Tax=Lutibacter holmesii TaxID=1137985 RepID=A0ABW3WLT2_9FLAO
MKKITTCILFVFIAISSYSQYIEGRIFDAATNKPIEGVNVSVVNLEDGTFSNPKGVYYLKIATNKKGLGNIQFSHIGYQTVEMALNKGQKIYNVYLVKNVNFLDEVALVNQRNLKQTISYKKLKSMKYGIFSFGGVLNNDKIFVVGGDASYNFDAVEKTLEKYEHSDLTLIEKLLKAGVSYNYDMYRGDFLTYDIPTNTWEKNILKFDKRSAHNVNIINQYVYILGGKILSSGGRKDYLNATIELLDVQNNTRIVDETNPHQAVNFASFNYQGNLIVLGGSVKMKKSGAKEYNNKVHLYNLKEGFWYQLDTMSVAKETQGVLIKDKIYLIGGFNKKPLSQIESYNLKTNTWQKEGNLFFGMESPAIANNNEIIYLFDKDKIYTYNTLTKELNEFYIKLNITYSKMYFSNNKLYILGGLRFGDFETTPSSALYSIDISEFNKTKIIRTKTL